MNKINIFTCYIISLFFSLIIIIAINIIDLNMENKIKKEKLLLKEIIIQTQKNELIVFNNDYYIKMMKKYNKNCKIEKEISYNNFIIIKQKCNQ